MKRLVLFLLVTVVDVRVHAAPLLEPKNCTNNCAVNTSEILTIQTPAADIRVGEGTSFIQNGDDSVTVVRGLMHVTAKLKISVKTLYGEVLVTDGAILIEANDKIVKVANLSSDMEYIPRGEAQSHKLPVGFSTYFSKITKSGVAEVGYPHPAEIESLIKKWGKVYTRKEKSRFADDLKDYLLSWHSATKLVAPWYVDTVRREIAAQEAEEARLARLKAEREAERRKYRDMLLRRIYE